MFSVCECHSQNLQRFYSWCMTHHIMSLQQPFPMCLRSSMIRTFAQQSRAHRFPDQIKIQKAMTFYYLSTDSAKTQVIVICSQKKKNMPSDGTSTLFAPTPQSTESFRKNTWEYKIQNVCRCHDELKAFYQPDCHPCGNPNAFPHRHNQTRALIYTVFLCCNKQESIERACNVQL